MRFNLTLHPQSVGPERVMCEIHRCKNVAQDNLSMHTLNSKLLIRFNDVGPNDMDYGRVLKYVLDHKSQWTSLGELNVYDFEDDENPELN